MVAFYLLDRGNARKAAPLQPRRSAVRRAGRKTALRFRAVAEPMLRADGPAAVREGLVRHLVWTAVYGTAHPLGTDAGDDGWLQVFVREVGDAVRTEWAIGVGRTLERLTPEAGRARAGRRALLYACELLARGGCAGAAVLRREIELGPPDD